MEDIVSPGTTPEAISALGKGKSHNKGPWKIDGATGYADLRGHRVNDPRGYVLAVAVGDVPELHSEANARLIAAAPDLLEVAKLLLRVDDEWKALSIDERTRVETIVSKATGQ